MANPTLSPKQLDWLKEFFQAAGQSAGVKALDQAGIPETAKYTPPPPPPVPSSKEPSATKESPTSSGNEGWRSEVSELLTDLQSSMDTAFPKLMESLDALYRAIVSRAPDNKQLDTSAYELRTNAFKDAQARISSAAPWRKSFIALCKNKSLSVTEFSAEAEKIAISMDKMATEWESDKMWQCIVSNPFGIKITLPSDFRKGAPAFLRKSIADVQRRALRD